MSYFTASDSYLGLDEKEAQSLFGKMTKATDWSKRLAARRSKPSLLTSSQAVRKNTTDNMMREATLKNLNINPIELNKIAVNAAGKSTAFKGMSDNLSGIDWSKGGLNPKTPGFDMAKAFDPANQVGGSTAGLTAGGGNAAATNMAMKIASLIFGTALSGIAQRREKHNLEQQQIAALPVGVGNKDWGIFDFFTG